MKNIKANEAGRSMIEMLGVLAIIGVLSVGGIAGYSKAMSKFRVNKTVDQIMQISTNVRTLFGSRKNYEGIASMTNEQLSKFKIAPDEMISSTTSGGNTTYNITNAYDGNLTLADSGKVTATDHKAFIITLTNIPEEACLELAAMNWDSVSGTGFMAFALNGANIGGVLTGTAKNAGTNSSGKVLAVGEEMSLSAAAAACATTSTNQLQWKYY